MKKFYPNLNSLRCIAAFIVILSHIEIYKSILGYKSLIENPIYQISAKLGVVLFFVLSGFLITSLLLHEKVLKSRINFKNFYIRRILRIWPLYYLIVIFGFFVAPYIHVLDIPNKIVFPDVLDNRFPNVFYYLTIFANLGWAIYKDVPYVSQSWSLATEEQFYLLWPFLIAFVKRKLIISMALILVTYWALKFYFETQFPGQIITQFWSTFDINCMAIGGIFAVIAEKKLDALKFIFFRPVFFGSVFLALIFLLSGIHFGFFHYDVYALLFGVIITNLACNDQYSKSLEFKLLDYLGSISYGLYMLHLIPMVVGIKIGWYLGYPFLITYPITIFGSIFLAHFSFKYFEEFFNKKRHLFQ